VEPDGTRVAAVDDLPVEGSYALSAMGVRVDVDVAGSRAAEVLERLPDLWELCPPPVPGTDLPRARLLVVHDADDEVGLRAEAAGAVARPDTEDLLQLLTQRVTVTAIDALAGRLHLLHAACLADPADGSAVAFAAPGGTGKTTLVRVLGPGRWYVTDEAVAVDDDGTLTAYPKPLSIRRSPASPFKHETPPSRLGLVPPSGPVRLRAIHLLDRDDGHAGPPEVVALDPLDALVALSPLLSHLERHERPLQRVAALCAAVGGVRRVRYRDAADLAPLLDRGPAT
jgi:hypothetical protein